MKKHNTFDNTKLTVSLLADLLQESHPPPLKGSINSSKTTELRGSSSAVSEGQGDNTDRLLQPVSEQHPRSPKRYKPPCICKDCCDAIKLFSIIIKGGLSLVTNWYILQTLDDPTLAWSLAALAAIPSIINRCRNQYQDPRALFRKKAKAPAPKDVESCANKTKSCCINGNLFLQAANNWSLYIISVTVQIWHACIHLVAQLPQNVICLPMEFIACLALAIIIAAQYKANRLDKQRMQLKGLSTGIKKLCQEKKYTQICIAMLIILGTVTAFAMTSFFVLKTILTDFLNYVLIKLPDSPIITDTNALNDINITVTVFSISAGIFQSICTASIVFKLFDWKEKITPHLSYFYKHKPGLFAAGILINLLYAVINAWMTVICVQYSFHQMTSTGSTPVSSNISAIDNNTFNCNASKPSHTHSTPEQDYTAWITMIAITFAILQNLPIFFVNILLNFFIPKHLAEKKELALIKYTLNNHTDLETPQDPSQTNVENFDNLILRLIARGRMVRLNHELGAPFEKPAYQTGSGEGTLFFYPRSALDHHYLRDKATFIL